MKTEIEIRHKLEELGAEPVLDFQEGVVSIRGRAEAIMRQQVELRTQIETLKWVLGQGEL